MKRRIFLSVYMILAVLAAISRPVQADDSKFFSALRDVPLMPGMSESLQDGLSFDKPEGRIVEAVATGNILKNNDIIAFYEASLPQLGWVSAAKTANSETWVRDGERLSLRIRDKGGLKILHLSLSP